jgi:hypothetical protein
MVVRLLAWLFLAMIAFSGVAWKAPLCHIGRLRRTAATVGLISCVGSGFVQPARAGEFVDEKAKVKFSYADDLGLVNSPKPVRTHDYEVLFKSENVKGFNVGITRDPVRIKSILDFATPQGLGEKVVNVELAKEGVFSADVLSATKSSTLASGNPDFPSYDVEYKIDSSRGKNHYLIKATVVDSKLFVLTAQAKEATFGELEPELRQILASLRLN